MKNTFRFVKPARISYMVAEQIKGMILDGTLKSGEKLPAERELSKMVGVGRFSLREGLRILESTGILETKYGVNSGTYVSGIGVQNLTERISDIFLLGKISLDQLIEARLEISLINLKYFIHRASVEDIKRLEKCIEETENSLRSGGETREELILFHQLVAEGSKNPVFLLLHNSLLDILLKQFISKYSSVHEQSKRFMGYNKEILRYLKEKDLDKAQLAMKKYLKFLGKTIRSRLNY